MLRPSISSAARGLFLVLAVFVLAGSAPCAISQDGARKREIRLGREAAVEVERQCRIITDPDITARVEDVGGRIAAAANSVRVEASYGHPEICRFDYHFKVVDEESVNAFSLPGGFIYVNKGLLDYVQSDHELAGVLAHEVAHSAHRHATALMKEQSRLDGKIALALLAGVFAGADTRDLGHLMLGAQLIRIATASGYGQRAEADADSTAVIYVERAGYNPVGALTFLERLARDADHAPRVSLGILQTHPFPQDRCRSVLAQIRAMGLPVNRRVVTQSLKAQLDSAVVNGQSVSRIELDGKVFFQPAALDGGLTSSRRAAEIAARVDGFLDTEPALRDVEVGSDGATVLGGGMPLLVVTESDSTLQGKPIHDIASNAVDVLKQAIWRDMISRLY